MCWGRRTAALAAASARAIAPWPRAKHSSMQKLVSDPELDPKPLCRISRMNAAALYEALTLLAAECSDAPARERAARVLLVQVRIISARGGAARSSWIQGLRRFADFDEALEDAIQHVAVVASTGKVRFRGRHPSEAVAWCQRIVLNFLISELRRRVRSVCLVPDELSDRAAPLDAHLEGVVWRRADQEAAFFLRGLEQRLWKHLKETRTPGASAALYRAV